MLVLGLRGVLAGMAKIKGRCVCIALGLDYGVWMKRLSIMVLGGSSKLKASAFNEDRITYSWQKGVIEFQGCTRHLIVLV